MVVPPRLPAVPAHIVALAILHSATTLTQTVKIVAFAAASAIQAGIRRERILNFMSHEQLLAWVRGVREQSSKFERKR